MLASPELDSPDDPSPSGTTGVPDARLPGSPEGGARSRTRSATDPMPHPAEADAYVRSLYRQYYAPLMSLVLRLTGGDRQWAEDVVQETLVRAWRSGEDFLGGDARGPLPWLTTVAKRLVIDDWRRRRPQPFDVNDPPFAAAAVSDGTERTLERVIIIQALATLSPAHRDAIVETYFRGRSIEQLAKMRGAPVGTIKSRLYYALRALRKALADRGVSM